MINVVICEYNAYNLLFLICKKGRENIKIYISGEVKINRS